MHRRLGNGMFLWLGGALLAHAALLALPGSSPDGVTASRSGMQVRIAPLNDPGTAPASPTAHAGSVASDLAMLADTDVSAEPHREYGFAKTQAVVPRERPVVGLKSDLREPSEKPHLLGRASARQTPLEEAPVGSKPELQDTPEKAPLVGQASARQAPPKQAPAELKSDLREPPDEMQLVGRASARQPTLGGSQASSQASPEVNAHARLLELTDRLHRAIEREKRYPLSARRLGREGTASVAFQLHPDGAIDVIQVASSSGEPTLDRAALRAVAGISPFGEAGKDLDESAPFRVDIAFRLR